MIKQDEQLQTPIQPVVFIYNIHQIQNNVYKQHDFLMPELDLGEVLRLTFIISGIFFTLTALILCYVYLI